MKKDDLLCSSNVSKDLSHPPTVTLNPKHRFRTADGRDNNLTGLPLLGAAAQAYSRSVKPLHPVAPYIAEPEDMFDAILRRPAGYGGFIPHPAGISSLLFAFANIIIHDLCKKTHRLQSFRGVVWTDEMRWFKL